MKVKSHDLIPILFVAALVAVMDVVVMPILVGYYHQIPAMIFFSDFVVVLLAGLAGTFFAPRVGCPLWRRHSINSSKPRRAAYFSSILGLSVVVINTVVNLVQFTGYRSHTLQVSPWLALLTPETALAISFRAALNEEVLFRLFLFPLVAWIVGRIVHAQELSLVTGALASSMVYGLIHPGFSIAFLVGLALVYVYHRSGLLSAMTVHFFADAIPFVAISMIL